MKRRKRAAMGAMFGALFLARSAAADPSDAPPAAPAAAASSAPASGTSGTSGPGSSIDSPDHHESAVVVWPTLTPAGDESGPLPIHRPKETEITLFARAQELDATLREAVEDLGFTLDVADAGPLPGHARDLDMIERASRVTRRGGAAADAKGSWVVSARVEELTTDEVLLRIVAVPPLGRELRVRTERVKTADVSVRGLVMVRDLLSTTQAGRAADDKSAREAVDKSAEIGIMSDLRSPGRAILAVNGALFGAYAAYSVQRTSGNDDPRLLYPLVALGTGIGIGAALLVSDEWDVSTGDAWVLSTGAWWGAGAGILIANGRHVSPLTDRYAWGIGGGGIGLALGTLALTRGKMDDGDAVLTNSGAAVGTFVGGAVDLFYRGTTSATPYTGAGYGAAAGLLVAGVAATRVQVAPERVLLIDLGAGLGAAAGAAIASPLVFGTLTETRARGFLSATAGGTLAGGALTWYLTRNRHPESPPALPSGNGAKKAGSAGKSAPTSSIGTPLAGVIGGSQTKTGNVPMYGIGWSGSF